MKKKLVSIDEGPIGVVTVAERSSMVKPVRAAPRRDHRPGEREGWPKKEPKALIVRVDSPGGSAMASERIRRRCWRQGKENPVVVSMGSVAASGGYWVANARRVYIRRAPITGSIGVFGVLPSSKDAAKLRVGADGIKTTPLSGEPDLLKGPRRQRTS